MTRFIGTVVILLLLVAAVGWYLGWFEFNKSSNSHEINFNVSVDKAKVKEDLDKATDKAKGTTQELKDKLKTSGPESEKKDKEEVKKP